MSICAYHRKNDKEDLINMLKDDFEIEISDSYMLWPWYAPKFKIEAPYFVTGVLRVSAKK